MKKLILGLGSVAAAVAPVAAAVSCSFESDSTTENIILNDAQKAQASTLFQNVLYKDGSAPADLTISKFTVQDAYKIAGSDYTSGFQVNIHVSQSVHASNGLVGSMGASVMFSANTTHYLAVTERNGTYTIAVYKIALTSGQSLPIEKFLINNGATLAKPFYDLLNK